MAREQLPRVVSVPIRSGQGVSSPLQDVQIYRPGPYIALVILLLPALITLGGATLYLGTGTHIPGWLPFTLLLWAPGLPLLWLATLAVRLSAAGIAAGRPWSRWVEIQWQDVERVEPRGLSIRIHGARGGKISFSPFLLRDGKRLERQLLLRLPTHVLTGGLATKAQSLLSSDIRSTPEGGYTGTLTIQVRAPFRWLVACIGLVAAAAAVLVQVRSSFGAAPILGAAFVVVAIAACLALVWALQRLRINETGVTVERLFIPTERRVAWPEIELIEHSPRQAFLRFRGMKRLFCAGPGLLSPSQATLMDGILAEYAGKRRIPMVARTWLWPW